MVEEEEGLASVCPSFPTLRPSMVTSCTTPSTPTMPSQADAARFSKALDKPKDTSSSDTNRTQGGGGEHRPLSDHSSLFRRRETSCQIHCGRGFSYATFLIRNSNNTSQATLQTKRKLANVSRRSKMFHVERPGSLWISSSRTANNCSTWNLRAYLQFTGHCGRY